MLIDFPKLSLLLITLLVGCNAEPPVALRVNQVQPVAYRTANHEDAAEPADLSNDTSTHQEEPTDDQAVSTPDIAAADHTSGSELPSALDKNDRVAGTDATAELSNGGFAGVEEEVANALESEKLLPKQRPNWVAAEDDFSGNVHTLVITTLPCSSMEECEQRLPAIAYQRFADYARMQLGINLSALRGIDAAWVMNRLTNDSDRFFVERQVDGVMTYSAWIRMQVDELTRIELTEMNQQSQWLPRSIRVGTAMLLAMAMFGGIHLGLLMVSSTKRS